jgi:predicted lipoprotein
MEILQQQIPTQQQNMKPALKQYFRPTQQEANQHDNKTSNSQKTVCQTDTTKSETDTVQQCKI